MVPLEGAWRMSELAPVIAERIRGVLLQGNADREALHRLADAHAREVGKVNTMLARCQRWVQRGCASEALSLADAAQLIPGAAALRLDGAQDAWNRLLHAAGLPPAPEVDVALLESLVAVAGKQEALASQLGAMRHSFLRRAPLQDRLQALHALADRDPRNPAWLEAVRRLEREAVAALADAAREAVRTEDTALAGEIVERLDAMALRGDEHAELFGRVRRIREADRALQLQRDARACADRLHAAAAAMDLAALSEEVSAWEALGAQGDPGDALRREVEGPLDLMRRELARRDLAARQKLALDQLELALDETRDMDALEQLADAVDRLEAEWPSALRTRLQDRRAQHGAKRARRRMLIGVVGVVLLGCLLGTGWWVGRALAAERRFDDAIAEVDRRVAVGELDAAAKVIEALAAEPMHAARPELAGARLRVANARDRARAAEAGADEIVARLDRIGATSRDPVEMEMAAREVAGLLDSQPASRRGAVEAAIARLRAAASTASDRSLEASRGAFHALTARLQEVADPARSKSGKFDRAAWSAAAESYDTIAREARAAASTAAAQRDGQAAAESLQGLATEASQRAMQARAMAERLEMVRGTLQKLEQSTDEQATLDLWERLLREGGDVLAERGMLRACESARDAAASGLGIRAWRTVVVPGLLAGRGDSQRGMEALDWGDAATARAMDGVLTRHLDEQPRSPYRPVAEQLRGLARRTVGVTGAEPSIAGAARAAIVSTGYAGLLEQSFEGGRLLYRRNTRQSPSPWAQAIESKADLIKSPEALPDRKPPAFKPTGGVRAWSGAAAVEEALAGLQGADGVHARDAVLKMLAQLRGASVSDPLLQWHATRDLWRIWLQMFADENDPEDAAAARWVRSLDGVSALLGEDPVLLGGSESNARSQSVRRQALDQLSRTFDASALLAAARRRDAMVAAGVRPMAPVGVILPAADGALGIVTATRGQRGAVPARDGDGWRLCPLRVEDGRVVWEAAPPGTPITWPQVLFIPGGDS
jgi:hypothetical protein